MNVGKGYAGRGANCRPNNDLFCIFQSAKITCFHICISSVGLGFRFDQV